MAGALNRRSRGGVSEDNGDTPSKASSRGGTDDGGGATIASGTHWDTPEVLAAMGDEEFREHLQAKTMESLIDGPGPCKPPTAPVMNLLYMASVWSATGR